LELVAPVPAKGALSALAIDWDRLDYLQGAQEDDPAFKSLMPSYVPGEGEYPIAFIIGEAPGAQDVIKRRPFVDAAGSVLRDLMATAGLHVRHPWFTNDDPEANCWLTNVVKFRPPMRNGTRRPTPEEVAAARPYLRQEWVAVGRPRIIIPIGGVAFRAVTGKPASILRAAGKLWPPIISNDDGAPLFVWPMVHPAFGLRTPEVQPLIEKDWETLAAWMAKHAPH
jgi:uracil-DNA glycosylase family 4